MGRERPQAPHASLVHSASAFASPSPSCPPLAPCPMLAPMLAFHAPTAPLHARPRPPKKSVHFSSAPVPPTQPPPPPACPAMSPVRRRPPCARDPQVELSPCTPPEARGMHRGDGEGAMVVGVEELHGWLRGEEAPVVVDVRPRLSYALEHVKGAVSFPYGRDLKGAKEKKVLERMKMAMGMDLPVVVYDAGSTEVHRPYSKAGTVVRLIKETFPELDVRMLVGGFVSYAARWPADIVVNVGEEVRGEIRKKLGGWCSNSLIRSVGAPELPPTKILPYLFVGSERNAADDALLRKLGITHLLVVGEELRPYFQGQFEYHQVHLKDLGSEPLYEEFPDVCAWLDTVREKSGSGAKVLIHCHAGASRSVSCALAYLIWLGYDLREAFALVKERRSAAAPNAGFMVQLKRWERRCSILSL